MPVGIGFTKTRTDCNFGHETFLNSIRKAWESLRTFNKPFLTAFSDGDPGEGALVFQREIPGAKGQNHVTIKNAMHYTQDDQGEELARVVIEFIAKPS